MAPKAQQLSIDEQFARFDSNNPHVFTMFMRFAWELKNAGVKRGSAKMIWERMRYEQATKTDKAPGEKYALNNIYTSRYARKLVEVAPDFEGWFETRATRAEQAEFDRNTVPGQLALPGVFES